MPRARLESLDLFRGATIASMVMVNNQFGPEPYAQLHHVPWHGWTFTDLVFPFFVWIAGVAATFSTAKRVERGQARGELLGHAAKRAAVLFAIGLALNFLSKPDFEHWRIPGVLQRIALAYLFGTLIYLYLKPRARAAALVALCAVYWIWMAPGGYELGDNFAQRVDEALLPGHLYQNRTWDPEGVWSTLTAIATFLFGAFTGDLLRSAHGPARRTLVLVLGGAVLFAAGLALDPIQPINKALWTVPYTLLTAGLAALTFGAAYWLVDVRSLGGAWVRPFTIFGVNALAVYVFHYVFSVAVSRAGLREPLFGLFEGLGPANASLAYSLLHVGASFVFAWALWRKGWVWKA